MLKEIADALKDASVKIRAIGKKHGDATEKEQLLLASCILHVTLGKIIIDKKLRSKEKEKLVGKIIDLLAYFETGPPKQKSGRKGIRSCSTATPAPKRTNGP